MGNQPSQVGKQKIIFEGEAQQQYFGKFKVYSSLGRDRKIMGIKSINSRLDILSHTSLEYNNLVKVLQYDAELMKEIWLANQQGIILYFDLYETSLQDIILARSRTGQKFYAKEIYRIGVDILKVLAYLEMKGAVSHWNINPISIFYDRLTKSMKIYDNEAIFGKYDQYFLLRDQQYTYFSPETVEALARYKQLLYQGTDAKKTLSQNDSSFLCTYSHKIDVYSLGLTLLEIATYLPSQNMYNAQRIEIVEPELERRKQLVLAEYGAELFNMISKMLEFNPEQRYTARELLHTTQEPPITQFPQQRLAQSPVRITRSPLRQISPLPYRTVSPRRQSVSRVLQQPPVVMLDPNGLSRHRPATSLSNMNFNQSRIAQSPFRQPVQQLLRNVSPSTIFTPLQQTNPNFRPSSPVRQGNTQKLETPKNYQNPQFTVPQQQPQIQRNPQFPQQPQFPSKQKIQFPIPQQNPQNQPPAQQNFQNFDKRLQNAIQKSQDITNKYKKQ